MPFASATPELLRHSDPESPYTRPQPPPHRPAPESRIAAILATHPPPSLQNQSLPTGPSNRKPAPAHSLPPSRNTIWSESVRFPGTAPAHPHVYCPSHILWPTLA